jgi:hypothetical protein
MMTAVGVVRDDCPRWAVASFQPSAATATDDLGNALLGRGPRGVSG